MSSCRGRCGWKFPGFINIMEFGWFIFLWMTIYCVSRTCRWTSALEQWKIVDHVTPATTKVQTRLRALVLHIPFRRGCDDARVPLDDALQVPVIDEVECRRRRGGKEPRPQRDIVLGVFIIYGSSWPTAAARRETVPATAISLLLLFSAPFTLITAHSASARSNFHHSIRFRHRVPVRSL